ncbi:dihydrodipicolinate synthase family protein [Herbaspirillum robiniae]|uniref:dihydrodipicolinate synthase family protein n=1 Tax=Herbaspirillum robiniae TaxID=2014887 RepID=UPI003D772749
MANFSRAQLRAALNGISGILVTPFDSNGKIAPSRLKPIVDKAVSSGVHVLVANGNTGEYFGLRQSESEEMVAAVTDIVGGRVPVLGGVGRSILEACDLARASQRAGVDALMIHQPPDPFVSPRGVVAYVQEISNAVPGLPIVLYLRNDNIGLDAIEALCRIPAVVGVKWASQNSILLSEAIRRTRDLDIAWVGGLAETWGPGFYSVGARGFTSGLINVFPEKSVEIHAALERSDYETARRIIESIAAFEELRAQENNGTNVTVVKAALQLMDIDCGPTRSPSAWPMKPQALEELKQLLQSLKN